MVRERERDRESYCYMVIRVSIYIHVCESLKRDLRVTSKLSGFMVGPPFGLPFSFETCNYELYEIM